MLLAPSYMISEIDSFCEKELGIPVEELMGRAGHRVASVIRREVDAGGSVLIFAGKGNNGGDGYACALELMNDYNVLVYDVFSEGQRRPEGKAFLAKFKEAGGRVENLSLDEETKERILTADCIVDAVFGTGFSGVLPPLVLELSRIICSAFGAFKVAIDVPLGVNADDGSVAEQGVCAMAVTVALCFIKPGLLSFPARAYVGKVVYDDLGLPLNKIVERFSFKHEYVDKEVASSLLPVRGDNVHKGSFGKLLCIVGSSSYRGAAHLAVEAALRGGVGIVRLAAIDSLCTELSMKYPEVIYSPLGNESELDESSIDKITELSDSSSAILVGSGSGQSAWLTELVLKLLDTEGAPLIIDADGINCLSSLGEEASLTLKNAKRQVILTPHPLEFSRLSMNTVSAVQLHRIEAALKFASENRVVLLLKGAATVCTDGKRVYINSTGSSALSKGGSGDVLAGLVASMIAAGVDPLSAAALSAYYHGAAADSLAEELSEFGVTPSDLPRQIAKELSNAK